MKIELKKFKMIEESKNKFGEFKFHSSVNIIQGENKNGKSTILKSLMYCLGFNVKKWAVDFNKNEFIYILNLTIDDKEHEIIRQGDTFIVDKICYLGEAKYKEKLNTMLDIKMELFHTNAITAISPYPTDIFLYSYVDQDNSYSNSLFKGNHHNYGMYKANEIFRVHEYLLGISNDEVDRLLSQKNKLVSKIKQVEGEIKQIESTIKIFEKNSKIAIPINSEELKKEIEIFETKINKLLQSKNNLELKRYKIINRLKMLDMEQLNLERIYLDLENEKKEVVCQICHSGISLDNFKNKYRKELNKNSLLLLYGECKKEIEIEEKKLEKIDEELIKLSNELDEIHKNLVNSNKNLNFNEILESNQNLKITQKFNEKIQYLLEIKQKNEVLKTEVSRELDKKKRDLQERKNKIKVDYDTLLSVGTKLFPDSKLENYKDKFLNFSMDKTGSDANITYVILYYIYFTLLSKYSRVKLPLIWDTIVKEAFDGKNDKKLDEFVNDILLKIDTQIIFSNIPNSNKDIRLKYNEEFNYIDIRGKNICNQILTEKEEKEIREIFKIIKNK